MRYPASVVPTSKETIKRIVRAMNTVVQFKKRSKVFGPIFRHKIVDEDTKVKQVVNLLIQTKLKVKV